MSGTSSQPALPPSFAARPATMDDLETAVALFNACAIHSTGAPDTTSDDLRLEWQSPQFDLRTATQVVLTADGRLVGYVEVWDGVPIPVSPWVWGRVHPNYEGRGVGTYLLAWGEARARQAIARCPDDVRVVFRSSAPNTYPSATRLFARYGMSLVRHFWRMAIDLHAPPSLPEWPAGLTLRTFADVGDWQATYHAVDDAFADHWGHVDQPLEDNLKQWRYWAENDKAFDPTLWFLLLDGDEIAGFSLCRSHSHDDPDMGWVHQLGVRRPWRQRGLGLALLQQSFAALHQRGRLRVGLGVDADSLTGATRLYEKAGMKVVRQYDTYEKELRPGHSISRQ